MEVRRLVITGRVQGVSYRAGMASRARGLGIAGWVRNRSDGSVEALVSGEAESLAQLIDWARRGPAGAAVEHVCVEAGEGSFAGFDILPTV